MSAIARQPSSVCRIAAWPGADDVTPAAYSANSSTLRAVACGTAVAIGRSDMGETTDTDALTADLMTVVQLLARDAVASAMAAGTTPGIQGVTLATRLG